MPKDYYVVLGVSKGADVNKIKKAYRMVVKKYHPDMASEEETPEKFLEIKEAYETLSDETKRKHYDDELARQGSSLRTAGTPERIRRKKSAFDAMDRYTSLADEFFKGFVPGLLPDYFEKGRGKGKELYLEVLLSPGEADQGGLFPITVPVIEPCPRCGKAGLWEDFFCPVCRGRGRTQAQREFSLSIPPHVQHGTEIRLSMEDIGLYNVYLRVTVFIDPNLDDEEL